MPDLNQIKCRGLVDRRCRVRSQKRVKSYNNNTCSDCACGRTCTSSEWSLNWPSSTWVLCSGMRFAAVISCRRSHVNRNVAVGKVTLWDPSHCLVRRHPIGYSIAVGMVTTGSSPWWVMWSRSIKEVSLDKTGRRMAEWWLVETWMEWRWGVTADGSRAVQTWLCVDARGEKLL